MGSYFLTFVVAEAHALCVRIRTSEKNGFDDFTIIDGASLRCRLGVFDGVEGVEGDLVFVGF